MGKTHDNEYGYKLNNKHKKIKKPTNKVRSYTQKYAYLKRSIEDTGVIPYDNDQLKDIYKFIKKLNEKQKDIREPYKLDVFKNFDFYEG